MHQGKKLRELRVLVRSPEHGTRVFYDPDAPPVSWITREDLFDWIWSMPEATVSAALGVQASWLCNLYKINRPGMSHWHRVRKGLEAPRDPIDPSLPPDAPVPLVSFEYDGSGSYAVIPDLLTWMRIGGPDRSGPMYPHDREYIPAFLAAGTSERPARLWSRGPVGPPRRPTIRELRSLIWDTDPDEAEARFALLGLSKREVAKLARRHGLRVPTPDWWSADRYRSRTPYPDRNRPRKLTPAQLDGAADLSAETLAQVRAEVAADLASEEASRLRRSEAAQAAADRARARLENGFGTVVNALVSGSSGNAACTATGVARITFRAELRRRLREALAGERGGTKRADNITGRLMRGTADRFEALLAEHVLRRGDGVSPTSTGQTQFYSNKVPMTAIPALVHWMVVAEAIADAQAELAGATAAETEATKE
ncbi:hypothetical protein [Sphingobium sp.]|uniref:hypothetical protein n=1 Tax=Sphingobium sp. TaxID=1912891 RepID=UPI0026255BDA|nr:hypothetical protein [Sphingobium sp.]